MQLPEEAELAAETALPNMAFPSDHITLAADFEL